MLDNRQNINCPRMTSLTSNLMKFSGDVSNNINISKKNQHYIIFQEDENWCSVFDKKMFENKPPPVNSPITSDKGVQLT